MHDGIGWLELGGGSEGGGSEGASEGGSAGAAAATKEEATRGSVGLDIAEVWCDAGGSGGVAVAARHCTFVRCSSSSADMPQTPATAAQRQTLMMTGDCGTSPIDIS